MNTQFVILHKTVFISNQKNFLSQKGKKKLSNVLQQI